MAYMNQDKKARIAPAVKSILKRYGVKGSLAVRNHSTLVLNIKSGTLDFIADYNKTTEDRPGGFRNGSPATKCIDVNPYWYREHFGNKVIRKFLDEIFRAMNDGNHNRSNIQIDYFDVGWYVDVNVGKWNKPYVLEQ
jgi:hypothetical protein